MLTLQTSGESYWSNTAKDVEIVDMRVAYINDEKDFGELRVYFNTATWDVNELGLIYTDKLFKQQLNAYLTQQGLATADYSEQGMQGNNYVSLDVEGEFLSAWEAKFNTVLA